MLFVVFCAYYQIYHILSVLEKLVNVFNTELIMFILDLMYLTLCSMVLVSNVRLKSSYIKTYNLILLFKIVSFKGGTTIIAVQ